MIAGEPLTGRTVELQQLELGIGWKTLNQLPVNKIGEVTFPAPAITTGSATLRIAMSVNEAGAGYLGTTSHDAHLSDEVRLARDPGDEGALRQIDPAFRPGLESEEWRADHDPRLEVRSVGSGKGRHGQHGLTGGHWSFPVKPTIQTSYVARWVSSNSVKLLVGVEPLATLNMLANGRIATHIAAGHSFAGRKVQLQELKLGIGWRTIEQLPLNRSSSAVFPALSASGDTALRIAFSVNQAGAGFLGTISHAFTYHRLISG